MLAVLQFIGRNASPFTGKLPKRESPYEYPPEVNAYLAKAHHALEVAWKLQAGGNWPMLQARPICHVLCGPGSPEGPQH